MGTVTSCQASFGFYDLTASGDATLTVSQNQSFANIADMNNEQGLWLPNVLTLEEDFGWPLDGTKVPLPDDAEATPWGWWSTEQSGTDGAFASPLTLVVSFTENHTSAGLTFDFVGTLPGAMTITWYDLDWNLLESQTFVPDAFTYVCDCAVGNYGNLVISIPSMASPGRFLRVTRILCGVVELLSGERLTMAKTTEEVDTSLLTLPINVLDLAFHTGDGRFALLVPSGVYECLQYRQALTLSYTLDGTTYPMGVYYFSEAQGETDGVTTLYCVDAIGLLDGVSYDGGIYAEMPMADFLDALLTTEGMAYTLDASFDDVTISGHLPICTKREALQQMAFAVGALVVPDRTGGLTIQPLSADDPSAVDKTRKIVGHTLTLEDLITCVEVTAHQFALSSDLETLSTSDQEEGEQTVKFTTPCQVSSITGATLVTSHPNYCTIQVDTAGEVVIQDKEYEDTETVYTVDMGALPAAATSQTKSVSTNTLIDPSKAQAAAQRLYDYYQNRYSDEGQLLPGLDSPGQYTALWCGDATLTGHLQRVVTDLHGGGLMTITMRGSGA